MNIETRLFRSILARRFFALFVISALVPIVILAAVAYWRVSDQLHKQARERLIHVAKLERLSIHERLLFLEAELGSAVEVTGSTGPRATARVDNGRTLTLFDGLAVVSSDSEVSTFFGEVPPPPELTRDQLDHLEKGLTLLLPLGGETAGRPLLAMARLLDLSSPRAEMVVGVISPNYLWGISGEGTSEVGASEGNVVPYGLDLCAYDEARRLLYGSFEGCREMTPVVAAETVGTHSGELDMNIEGEKFVAHYRNLFLVSQFYVDTWSFVLLQSEVDILKPMKDFQWVFPLVVLVCLWIVLLLSSFAIRRSLVPLDRLTEGTRRIAERDFSTRVEVDSGDEFDDLAGAFNAMSDRLQRQFSALSTNAEIHRAILSTIDMTTIVETATAGALETIDCDLVCVGVRGVGDTAEAALFYAASGNVEAVSGLSCSLSAWDIDALSSGTESVVLSDGEGVSELLASLPASADSIVVAFPVMLGSRLSAVLCVVRIDGRNFSEEELDQGRQLADQVAVAFSNSSLIEELKALTWGTLEALARAIDAKSPWTAGHSGRVTAMALKIAQALGRSRSELQVLHRGALLHDVGKLGISIALLDKPGRLEYDEMQQVMAHPSIGGRILEPISAFADILPIVTDHHERWDGRGYPNGLAGEEIHINARILAVADTYDAMTSDRPYRKGRDTDAAVEEIRNEAGSQFDPRVVEAFLVMIGRDPKNLQVQPDLGLFNDVAGRGA